VGVLREAVSGARRISEAVRRLDIPKESNLFIRDLVMGEQIGSTYTNRFSTMHTDNELPVYEWRSEMSREANDLRVVCDFVCSYFFYVRKLGL
jgi:hypothetical protein